MIWLQNGLEIIEKFMDAGGNVLWLIALTTFIMWTLVFERYIYYKVGLPQDQDDILKQWDARPERTSWNAHRIREKLISEVELKIRTNLDLIKNLVALCPLLGLLGTVTGMIEVFNIMAVTGGGDAKSMAGGVSKATIPTMAGMVAALSGVFSNTYITSVADREVELLADHLTPEH